MTQNICIVYENDKPTHVFNDENLALECASLIGQQKISDVNIVLKNSNLSEALNNLTIKVVCIKSNTCGMCTSTNCYNYDFNSERFEDSHDDFRPIINSFKNRDNSISIHHKISTKSPLTPIKSELNPETIANDLVQKISEVVNQNSIGILEDMYEGLAEEALIDADINLIKQRLNDACNSESDPDEYNYIDSDSDLISNPDSNYNETDSDSDIEIHDDMPDYLKTVIEERNALKDNIKENTLIINKANEKLNEELFIARCEEQNKKKLEQKQKESESILFSDKNTYLKIKSKIKDQVLHEKNIPILFKCKYYMIKFMEDNDLIVFKKNADISTELFIYSQLQKVFDVYEKNKDDTDETEDLMDEIHPDYVDLCLEYLELLQTIDYEVLSEKKINSILDENQELKDALFNTSVKSDVFVKDTEKEQFN